MIKEIAYRDKAEWLSLRKNYIGGSDAAAVVGLNPYCSPYALWAEKTGQTPPFEGNVITEVGSYLEALVADMFTRETGKKVRRKNRMMVNDLYPFACADVDRVVIGENAILECKTTNSVPAMRKFKQGEYPEHWYCQMMHYMAVGGYEKAYLGVLIGCREFKHFELYRDEAEIAALMGEEKIFWENVQTKTAPPVDGHISTSEALSAILPESTESTVTLFGYDADLQRFVELAAQAKAIKAEQESIANRIKAFMGDAGRGDSDRFHVTFNTQTRKTFDAIRFAAEHPEIDITKYFNVSKARPFKVAAAQ